MVGTSIHNEKLSFSIFHGVTVGPLTEFNVTSQKTDDAVFGVEVESVFETAGEDPRISPNAEISVRIDGQSTPAIPIRLGGGDSPIV